ncbi:MAG: restriction endonuclease, partial [Candidatus Babeliales bacterium]
MSFIITKRSGDKEPFNEHKLRSSLHKAGAHPQLIDQIVHEVEQRGDLRTTKDIYAYAYAQLRERNVVAAGRYSIKQALLEMGPSGFPFEQFVAEIFKAQGYRVETDQTLMGACVSHEIDVIIEKSKHHGLVECKFHNELGLKSDVKVPLYVKSRFDDIENASKKEHLHLDIKHNWIVTNTSFSEEAVQYATCVDIKLISWSYPAQHNLPQLIEEYHLYPVTALASLTHQQKRDFIGQGFTLCRDAAEKRHVLERMGLSAQHIDNIIAESHAVCK